MASAPLSGASLVRLPVASSRMDAPAPSAPDPRALIVADFELSLARCSLDRLERAAAMVDRAWLEAQFERFGETEEATLLATCCRREVAVVVRSAEAVARWEAALPLTAGSWRRYEGREATQHLVRVAAGRESVVVGENEVRAQVRGAARATLSRHRARVLRDLFEGAAKAAELAVPSGHTARSIAAVAATRALDRVGRPFPRVLVVGSGVVGRQVTELLAPSARVTMAYRYQPPDETFLRRTGARAVRTTELAAEVELSDAVVTATSSGERCLGLRDLGSRRPVVLIDLGMPRNVDPDVRGVPGVELIDLEDIGASGGPTDDDRLERRLEELTDRLHATVVASTVEPWVAAVRRSAEELRRAELDVGRRFLGALTPDQELALDRLTRRLVDRLLREPTARLRALPQGADGDRLRRFALELWRTDVSRP